MYNSRCIHSCSIVLSLISLALRKKILSWQKYWLLYWFPRAMQIETSPGIQLHRYPCKPVCVGLNVQQSKNHKYLSSSIFTYFLLPWRILEIEAAVSHVIFWKGTSEWVKKKDFSDPDPDTSPLQNVKMSQCHCGAVCTHQTHWIDLSPLLQIQFTKGIQNEGEGKGEKGEKEELKHHFIPSLSAK